MVKNQWVTHVHTFYHLWFGHTLYPYVLLTAGFAAVLDLQPKMCLKIICSVLCCLTGMLFGSLKCGPQI